MANNKLKTTDRRAFLLASVSTLTFVVSIEASWAQTAVEITGDVSPNTAQTPDWYIGSSLIVGETSVGTMVVMGGGTVTSISGSVGFQGGSVGAVTVTGQSSAWTNSDTLYVGGVGTGSLRIEAGGAVSNTNGFIGQGGGAIGVVTVTGTSSTWANSGVLYIGNLGTGTLNVEESGAVTNTTSYIGKQSDSVGLITVEGINSTWTNSGTLYLGDYGTGTLNVEAGGTVWNTVGNIGVRSGSIGTTTVTGAGSSWINSNVLYVGNLGNGTLSVHAGGSVSAANTYIGFGNSSTSTVKITGAGSQLANSGSITIGSLGSGKLEIEHGGAVTNSDVYIGASSTGLGEVTVTGTGSTWTNSSALRVGHSGNGKLSVEDGGAVTNTFGILGFVSGSLGEVTVTGLNTSWINNNTLRVGGSGNGLLIVNGGGEVTNTTGYIGDQSSASGFVTISGVGSKWTNTNALIVGSEGAGTLTVSEGAVVSVGNAATGVASIAGLAVSTGTVNIGASAGDAAAIAGTLETGSVVFGNGTGSLVFNHTGDAGGSALSFAPTISTGTGPATIYQIAGATILEADNSGFTGTTNVSGGELTLSDALGGSASVTNGKLSVNGALNGDVDASATGIVNGSGTIFGNLNYSTGGILEGVQGQTLTITGNLNLASGSSVSITLGAAPSAALLDVGGDLTLDGTLNIADQGGFGAGVYRLFDYSGALTDNTLDIGTLPAGLDANTLLIQTAAASQVNLVSTAGAELGFWDGGNASVYDNNTVDGGSGTWRSDGRSWADMSGVLNGPYQPNPTFAVFQGVGGTVIVNNDADAIGVTGVQFAINGYRIQGDALTLNGTGGEAIIRVGDGTGAGASMTATVSSELSGTSQLIKSDLGTLVLSGTNTYSGGTELRGGILSVSADENLGDLSGDLAFAGGTLATTSSFNTGRSVALNEAGRFAVVSGTQLGLTGDIIGAGNLMMGGPGTLILSGANIYGNTLVQTGTVVGHAGSISGDIKNAGTVVFDQGADAMFAGDILGLGGASGAMIKRGNGELVLNGVSDLNWSIERGELVSASDRFFGDLQLATGTGFTFDQSFDGTYEGTISGTGAVSVEGGGTVLMTGDSSGYAGTSEVLDTTLIINGSLGGSSTIGSGAVLGGSGTLGSGAGSMITFANGSTLAPGNSIGTINVVGNLLINPGSNYEVEVDPVGTTSDLVTVSGTATINGGAVSHIGMTGTYDPTSTYTILKAAGGVTGTFDAVSSDFVFLDPTLDYSSNAVTLSLTRNATGFVEAGETTNQQAAATGLDNLAAGNGLYAAVVQLDATTAKNAFDQISGEIHASATTSLIEDSRHIRNTANDRIRAAFDGIGSSTAPVLGYGPTGPELVPSAYDNGMVGWGAAFGSWGNTGGDGNAAQIDRSTSGFLVGSDVTLQWWRLGLMAGYSHSSFEADDRVSSGSSDNYHLGVYGGTKWGKLAFRSGLSYTWSDIETSRAISFTGFNDTLSADYGAGTLQAFGEMGYTIETEIALFEPFLNLAHVNVRRGETSEHGGAAALTVYDQKTDVTTTTIGVRAQTKIVLGEATATLTSMGGWRHMFGDTISTSTQAIAGGDQFTIAGAPVGRDSAVVEMGLNLNLTDAATLGMSYQGQFGSGAQDHGFKAQFEVRF